MWITFCGVAWGYSSDYFLSPQTESGENVFFAYFSHGFQDYFDKSYGALLKSYFVSVLSRDFEYAVLASASYFPYGVFSVSALERDVDQMFVLPQQNFSYEHKEGAVNLTYQNGFDGYLLQVGMNISDPIYMRAFRGGGQIVYSMNLGLQVQVEEYCVFEFGVVNLFKESSIFLPDRSERFFSGLTLKVFGDFMFKVMLHYFLDSRVRSHMLSRYQVSENWEVGVNVSVNSFVAGAAVKFLGEYFSIESIIGVKEQEFFVSVLLEISFYDLSKEGAKRSSVLKRFNKFTEEHTTTININTADESQLMSLYGIGENTAQKIIQYRQRSPFYEKEDLMLVQGIGHLTFQKVKDHIYVGHPDPSQRLCILENWSMRDFVMLGLKPSSAFDVIVFIHHSGKYKKPHDLKKVKVLQEKIRKKVYNQLSACIE